MTAAPGRSGARVVAVVQARMSSSRLPGKVLAELGPGRTIELLLRRLGRARELAEIVVATSEEPSDDPVADAVEGLGTRVVRGPLADVLERLRLAAVETGAEGVVRVTADCPMIEPALVDRLVSIWRREPIEYARNMSEPRTLPDGLDAEILSREALDAAAAEATDPYDREHVTPFIRARPERFPMRALRLQPPARDARLTLDTPEDLAFLRSFIRRVGPDADLATILAAAGAAEWELVEYDPATEGAG